MTRDPDPIFSHPRLAAIYDVLDDDRSDLDAYLAIVDEYDARRVLDIGCGTGAFACLLAGRGIEVVGLDPAAASLAIARQKAGAGDVTWVHGDVAALPPLQVDLVTMTANVAQAIVEDDAWLATLRACHRTLRPGGRLVFETRVPEREAWRCWNRAETHRVVDVPRTGAVETWIDLLCVDGSLVSFRHTYRFADDGVVLTSDSTLRFREYAEIERSLSAAGFTVEEVRDAPDRPGLEWVFVASAG